MGSSGEREYHCPKCGTRIQAQRMGGCTNFWDVAKTAVREGAAVEDAALAMLARAADGSVRDGLSLLDQAIALGVSGAATAGGGADGGGDGDVSDTFSGAVTAEEVRLVAARRGLAVYFAHGCFGAARRACAGAPHGWRLAFGSRFISLTAISALRAEPARARHTGGGSPWARKRRRPSKFTTRALPPRP